MRHILLLTLFGLLLVACSQPSTADISPNIAATVEAELAIETRAIDPTDALLSGSTPVSFSPTPLPEALLGNAGLQYDEALFGKYLGGEKRLGDAAGKHLAQPEHISFGFDGGDRFHSAEVNIYPLDHYMAISKEAAGHISMLEEMLLRKPAQITSPLPLYPEPAYAISFASDPIYVNFSEGTGIQFTTIVEAAGEETAVHAFQGISSDKKFLITAIVPSRANITVKGQNGEDGGTLSPVADRAAFLKTQLAEDSKEIAVVMGSLSLGPDEAFPSAAPPAYFSIPGVLLAYDPSLTGEPTAQKEPPVYVARDGTATYLSGVPDAIHISFEDESQDTPEAILTIQPVRGATGQFYASVPDEQKKRVTAIEQEFSRAAEPIETETKADDSLDRPLSFPSGSGKRSIQPGSADDDAAYLYEFEGVTQDGRYYVRYSRSLPVSNTIEVTLLASESKESAELITLLAELDQMMQSLVIHTTASADSSLPSNAPDCNQDAQFIEDITIPDHTIIERGQPFRKTWLIRNTGSCTWTPAYQIVFAGGNPMSWGKASVIGVVGPGEETEIGVEIISPEIPGNYHAWWQLADDMGNPFGTYYYALFESPEPATEIPGYGVVEGDIGYPAGGVPALTIYFMATDGSQRFALETEDGWTRYANELPVGEYLIFARVAGDESDSGGGYTESAKCDMICDDHSLIPVVIEEAKTTRDINILDWYAPSGSFPLP